MVKFILLINRIDFTDGLFLCTIGNIVKNRQEFTYLKETEYSPCVCV